MFAMRLVATCFPVGKTPLAENKWLPHVGKALSALFHTIYTRTCSGTPTCIAGALVVEVPVLWRFVCIGVWVKSCF